MADSFYSYLLERDQTLVCFDCIALDIGVEAYPELRAEAKDISVVQILLKIDLLTRIDISVDDGKH